MSNVKTQDDLIETIKYNSHAMGRFASETLEALENNNDLMTTEAIHNLAEFITVAELLRRAAVDLAQTVSNG